MPERVVVVGNCQAAPLTKCLRMLNPSLEIKVVPLALCKDRNAQEVAAAKLKNADIIFHQPGADGALRLAGIECLSAAFSNLVPYPKVTFYGFHPDFVFLKQPGGALVGSACGAYHSIIAAAAFANGLTAERTLQLFNSYIFVRLGYLDKFASWKTLFLSRAQEIGYDLHGEFETWLHQGAFMHTWQHPTIRVLASIAVRAMAKANLKQMKDARDLPDPLARASGLPVFPEIARTAGVAPILNFRMVNRDNKSVADQVSLNAFVHGTHMMYKELDNAAFKTAAITAARAALASEILN